MTYLAEWRNIFCLLAKLAGFAGHFVQVFVRSCMNHLFCLLRCLMIAILLFLIEVAGNDANLLILLALWLHVIVSIAE